MLKAIFAVLFLTFSLSAHAQMFSPRNPKCEAPNSEITVRELQEILESTESVAGCDVYQTQYYESVTELSGEAPSDGYTGPILLIKMISNDPVNFAFGTDIFAIRADNPLCIERKWPRETISYKLDLIQGDGFIDYLFNMHTRSRRIYIEFTNGKLNMAEQEMIVVDGGAISNTTNRNVFRCGALSPVDVAPVSETTSITAPEAPTVPTVPALSIP